MTQNVKIVENQFLIDFYAVLGAERNASSDQLHHAYREKMRQYHPDIVARAAPEIQQKAAAKSRLLSRAYEVLSNPETKEAYDEKLKDFDPALISKDGIAKIDIRRKRVDVDYLLSGSTWDQKSLALDNIRDMIGHSEDVFQLVEQQYKSVPNPSPELVKAYQDLLTKKSTYLALLEEIEWEGLGVSNPDKPFMVPYPSDYLGKRREQILQVRKEIGKSIESRVDSLTSGVTLKALTDGRNYYDSEALEKEGLAIGKRLTERALERFELGIPKIEDLAQQRIKVLEELVQFTKWSYFPENQTPYNKLLILVPHEGVIVTELQYELNGDNAIGTSPRVFRGMSLREFMSDKTLPQLFQLNSSGVNTTILYKDDELDLLMQMGFIVTKHSERVTQHKT